MHRPTSLHASASGFRVNPAVSALFGLILILATGCATQTPRETVSDPSMRIEDDTTTVVDAPNRPVDAAVDPRAMDEGTAPGTAPTFVDNGTEVFAETLLSSEAGPQPASEARTQAERDFDAIYGAPYDPVADPTLPAAATLPSSYDPWEPLNRRVHAFNNAIDRNIATPLARAYAAVVPKPVRLGVGNFFSNLGQPVSSINALLQGKPGQAGASMGRFLVNVTVGIGGLFDPATRFNIPNRSEDFGQTLGVWGWENSRYVELPLFGPRTVRDVFGLVGDAPLSPVQQVDSAETRYFLQGLQLVDLRTQLFAIDSMREGATDEYALFRDSWLQRRDYQIFGDRLGEGDDSLPDYLQDEQSDTTVPVDVMPIVPGGGG